MNRLLISAMIVVFVSCSLSVAAFAVSEEAPQVQGVVKRDPSKSEGQKKRQEKPRKVRIKKMKTKGAVPAPSAQVGETDSKP